MLTMKPNIKLRWMIVCAALIVIIASLAACQPPAILTSDDLVGVWSTDGGGYFMEYREDGTYRHAESLKGLETLAFEKGQYQLQGTQLTMQTAKDSVKCKGLKGSYQVHMNKDGELKYELEEDECVGRGRGMSTSVRFHRVSP